MSKLNKKDLSIKEENKENFKESLIERKNLTNQFKISDIEKHLVSLNKMKKEADGTIGLAKATKDNIEKNHKDVLDKVSEEEKHHIYLWFEQDQQLKQITPQLKDIDEEIKKHQDYLDTIYDAFGFKDEITIDINDLA